MQQTGVSQVPSFHDHETRWLGEATTYEIKIPFFASSTSISDGNRNGLRDDRRSLELVTDMLQQ